MKWNEVKIVTTEEASDAITEMLTGIGAGGVAIEDPNDIRREISKPNTLDYADDKFLSGLGEDVVIKAYFPGDRNIEELSSLINEKIAFISNFLDIGKGYSGHSELDEEDWANAWKKYFKPFSIAEGIVIKPTWEHYDAVQNETVIQLDPGMAFGTGTHETTRLCAGLLKKYLKSKDTVIDLGCGTGILAIIAAKLGAENIKAIDIDSVAVRITRENSELNNVACKIEQHTGIMDDLAGIMQGKKADVLVANIIANVIIGICKDVPSYLKEGGLMITSGIIKERRQEVYDTYTKQGFECLEVIEMGEWVAMVFRCPGSL